MKRILVVGVGVIAWGWVAPACAGWQDTEWGMTVDEVEQRAAGVYRPKQFSDTGDPARRHLLSRAYTSGEFSFITKFHFDRNGKLVEVMLDLIDSDKCEDLQERLTDTYGMFAIPGVGRFGVGKWKDAEHGNMVSYNRPYDSFCNVTYAPIAQLGAIGGL